MTEIAESVDNILNLLLTQSTPTSMLPAVTYFQATWKTCASKHKTYNIASNNDKKWKLKKQEFNCEIWRCIKSSFQISRKINIFCLFFKIFMFQTAKIISLNRLCYRCYKKRNIIKFQSHQFSLLRIKINTISSILIKGLVSSFTVACLPIFWHKVPKSR